MSMIVVLFNLKPGVSASDYESWAIATDIPAVNRLPSVQQFQVLRSAHLLGSDAAVPYTYVELLEVDGLEQLGADIATEKMQAIAAEFQQFAESPQFIVTENLA